MKKQTGGTLVGFIIGLLVGLGVALGVAVYVTKVPVPFMDRDVQRKPDQEAQEVERNKNWNPNATLSTKPAPAKVEPAATVPEPAPAPAAPPTTSKAKPDALGDLIQSKAQTPGPAAKVEAQVVDPFVYFVQAGAFRSQDEAEAQRAKLALGGFDAKVSEREQAGKAVYRVRLGPYSQKTEAESMTDNLKNQGFDTALVRVQR
jgi:cell division protein FtsN